MIRGQFLDGETSALVDARLEIAGTLILLRHDDGTLLYQCQRNKISVSSRLGNTPRLISLDPDLGRHSFETDDNDGIDQLFQAESLSSSWMHKLETNLGLIGGQRFHNSL